MLGVRYRDTGLALWCMSSALIGFPPHSYEQGVTQDYRYLGSHFCSVLGTLSSLPFVNKKSGRGWTANPHPSGLVYGTTGKQRFRIDSGPPVAHHKPRVRVHMWIHAYKYLYEGILPSYNFRGVRFRKCLPFRSSNL